MNRDDGISAIVLAAEHFLDLAPLDEGGELLDPRRQLGRDVLALGRPVHQHSKILGFGFERGDQLDFFLDATAALEGFLRLDLVVPEIGRRGARLYLCELVSGPGGLKDNSGDRRRASPDPGTGGSSHRER
jgi:hypothetical protein